MNQQSTVIDLVLFARYYWKHWALPTLALTLCLGAGIAYFILTKPVYRAQTTLLYQSIQQQDEGTNLSLTSGLALLGIQGSREPERSKAFGILKSGAFLLPFIHRLHLEPDLFPRRYNSQRALLAGSKEPTANELHNRFIDDVMTVDTDDTTGLITLSIFLPTPQQARNIANQLVEDLNDALRTDAVSQAQANINYLERQLVSSQIAELRSAIAQLVQSEMRRLLLASGDTTRTFAVIDPAITPDKPYAPRPILIAGISILVGLIIGLVSNLFRFLKSATTTA